MRGITRRLSSAALMASGVVLSIHPTSAATTVDPALISRGEYLARAGDCIACHTAPGGKPFAGGLGMETPFGTIYTPNLTPDKATGIGDWSDDDFYKAMHEGIGKKKEYLYPVFPFPWYTKVRRDDVLAIKAYLFSLPPENAPQKPLKFAFPFNVRTSLLAWRTAFFKPGEFVANPKMNDEVNHGGYLVEGLGHCGECHNKSALLGASNWSGKLEGGQVQGWYAPNISSDGKEGVGAWKVEEIVQYLHTGSAPGRGIALGPMKETVDDSLSHLSVADLGAMAAYLKSFSTPESYKPLDTKQVEAAGGGASLYLTNCASCHGVDGKGQKGMIPALAGNGAVAAGGPENVIRVVLGGLPAQNGYAPMPAVGVEMSDADIAAAVNYVRTAWGNNAPANAEPGKVGKLRPETATLMSPSVATKCGPTKTLPALAKAIDGAGVTDAFKGIKAQDMLQKVDEILPKIKTSDPQASNDDIVNAMIEAYCPVALSDQSVPEAGRTGLIGSFGGLVYGQVRNLEDNGTLKQ